MTLISVLVLSYNHERWVVECLDSIASQDYSLFEIIILDDGSSDNSASIIQKWVDNCKPDALFLRNILNCGNISSNLNRMMRVAHGEYITVIAADDRMTPCRLTKQVSASMSVANVVLSFGTARLIDEDSQSLNSVIGDFEEESAIDLLPLLLGHNCVPGCTAMFRRDAALKIGGFDEDSFVEDYDMWLRLSMEGLCLALPEILADYRCARSSVSNQYPAKVLFSAEESLIRFCISHRISRQYRAIASRSILNILARRARDKMPISWANVEALFRVNYLFEFPMLISMLLPLPWRIKHRILLMYLKFQALVARKTGLCEPFLLQRSDCWRLQTLS